MSREFMSVARVHGGIVDHVKYLQVNINLSIWTDDILYFIPDNVDAMDQRYVITCNNHFDTMKVGGVFQYGLKSLQYDCDRR